MGTEVVSCFSTFEFDGELVSDRWLSVSGPIRLITSMRKR